MDCFDISILVIDGQPVNHTDGKYAGHFQYMFDNYAPFTRESWRFAGTFEDVEDAVDLARDSEWHSGIVYPGFALIDKNGNPFDYFIVDLGYVHEVEDEDIERAIRDYCIDNGIEVSGDIKEFFDSLE